MSATQAPQRRGGDWLDSWNPEEDWDSRTAWKTLWITTFNLTLAFATWFLVSALAPQLSYLGFQLSKGQLYWLAAMPGLAGGFLRLVWMFLPPIMGTRKLVWMSSLLLIIPLVGWGMAVQNPDTSYTVLLVLAALAGIGGGVFSGFMPSTSYFFPKAKQGTALGIQAGIGNFGVSLVQFVTPWIVGFTLIGGSQLFVNPDKGIEKDVWYQNAGWIWVPFVIVGVIFAFTMLRSVPVKARGVKDQLDIFGNKHTWLMTLLYVLTFGTFSGMAAQFGLLIKNFYGTPFGADGINPLSYAFLGALVGSAARVLAGPIADKVGGAKVTLVSPDGTEFRVHASHDFAGHSQWNPLHGPMKEALWGDHAHLYVAGHKHNWALFNGEHNHRGNIFWLGRARGYKVIDHYADLHGFGSQNHGHSIMAVVDPSQANGPAHVQCFADPFEGVEYLKFKRRGL